MSDARAGQGPAMSSLAVALSAGHLLRQLEHERKAILARLSGPMATGHSEWKLRMLPADSEIAARLKAACAAKTAEIDAAHDAAESAWAKWEADA